MRNYLIIFLLIIYGFWQIFTLPYSPLPWFDETFFAHIAHNWWQSGRFMASVAIFEEVKAYGPVYFILTGLSLGIFGLEIWAFRIVNFLFGIANLFWIYHLLKLRHPQLIRKHYWLILPLLMDPFYHLSLHEGRMDLVALFFMLGGVYWTLRSLDKPKNLTFFYSGVLVSLALLTTPRSGFMLFPFLIVGAFFTFYHFRQRVHFALIWGGTVLGIYSLWVLYAFGNWVNLWRYYTEASDSWMYQESLLNLYLGNSGYLPRQTLPLLLVVGFVVLFHWVWQRMKLWHYVTVFSALNIIFFYLLVYDFGPYSVFLTPFYYYLIVDAYLSLYQRRIFLIRLAWFALLFFNLSYFSLKNYQIWISLPQRNHQVVDEFIRTYIPKNSRVIGDPMFTYSVLKAGSDYQYMDLYETLESREKRQREDYRYQYIIITEHLAWRKPEVVEYYLQNAKLELVAKLELSRSKLSQQLDELGWLSTTERTAYSCRLYRSRR